MKDSMNVVQIPHVYRPSLGGVENYVYRLNRSLETRGHETTTITTDVSLANTNSPLDPQADVAYCETDFTVFRNPFSIDLHRRVKRSTADLYHLHNLEFFSTVEAVHALPADAPSVLTVHGFRPSPDSFLQRALTGLYHPVAAYVLNRVDRTVVLGATEKEALVDAFDVDPSTVDVVPNGIHPAEFEVSHDRVTAFNRRYGLDPETPTILFVGRMVPLKRPHLLVDALFEYLPDRDLDAVVVGTGSGEYERAVRERADDRVHFLANLPFDELKAAYHASDLFTQLSGAEGLPTVVLEAMHAELPVVATSVGALPDVLNHRENGWLLDAAPAVGDVAEAIRFYLDHPDERRRVGARNREVVYDRYDWSHVADGIVSTYERALD